MISVQRLSIPLSVLIAGLALLWGLYSHLEMTYAKQEHLLLVEMRLDQKILMDRKQALQETIWKFEDRYGLELRAAPDEVKDQHRRAKHELNQMGQDSNNILERLYEKRYGSGSQSYRSQQ